LLLSEGQRAKTGNHPKSNGFFRKRGKYSCFFKDHPLSVVKGNEHNLPRLPNLFPTYLYQIPL
jgi:hypothetical protein